jgi:hypothetical protein
MVELEEVLRRLVVTTSISIEIASDTPRRCGASDDATISVPERILEQHVLDRTPR